MSQILSADDTRALILGAMARGFSGAAPEPRPHRAGPSLETSFVLESDRDRAEYEVFVYLQAALLRLARNLLGPDETREHAADLAGLLFRAAIHPEDVDTARLADAVRGRFD